MDREKKHQETTTHCTIHDLDFPFEHRPKPFPARIPATSFFTLLG
jgi:hypothetical protein